MTFNFTTKLLIGAGIFAFAMMLLDAKTEAAPPAPPAPPHEKVFQVPEHVIVQLRDELEQLRKDAKAADAEADKWHQKYDDAYACVHQHAAEQRPVLSCFKTQSENGTYNPEQQDF